MSDLHFITGIIGSLVLVTGAAWPEGQAKHPTRSIKNWLFAIGGLILLGYAVLGYLAGGSLFFVFLEALVVVASVLMMANTKDLVDYWVIGLLGGLFIIWSLALSQDYQTVLFIFGLIGIALGYALEAGSVQRNASLTAGSLIIAIFSSLAGDWIFFVLNVFFAFFSAYYLARSVKAKR